MKTLYVWFCGDFEYCFYGNTNNVLFTRGYGHNIVNMKNSFEECKRTNYEINDYSFSKVSDEEQ